MLYSMFINFDWNDPDNIDSLTQYWFTGDNQIAEKSSEDSWWDCWVFYNF